jgi:PAS domain S-box-containing protein
VTDTPVATIRSRLGVASRDVLEALLAHIADAVYLVDVDGRIAFVNPAALTLLGYEEDELLGLDAHATLHHHRLDGRPYPAADCPILRARPTRETVRGDGEAFWRKDGTSLRIDFSSAPLDTTRGPGAVVVFRDVTERMAAERAALHQVAERARAQEIHASRARLVEAADDERRRLVRDLHDGSQQRLVRILLELRLAAKQLTGRAGEAGLAARLEEIAQETTLAIAELRELSSGLSPQILVTRGLAAAVESLTAVLPIPVELAIAEQRFAQMIETTAYFFVAESLNNVIKHSRATAASVSLTIDRDGQLVLQVVDDGRGGATPRAGGGLAGMSDRLAAAGGEVALSSPVGGGTSIVALLPGEAFRA